MKLVFLAVVLTLLAGCSSIPRPLCPGTRSYDPQVCRGEKFQRIPNFENEAIVRRQRGEMW
jgi:hypothetical protein